MEGDPVIRLMGPVALCESNQAVEITSSRQRRLLAALAISAPHVVGVDRLVDIVWLERHQRPLREPCSRTFHV